MLLGISAIVGQAGMADSRKYPYAMPPMGSMFETRSRMTQRARAHLSKAAECECLSRSTLDEAVKGMYLDLAQRWRDLSHEAENIDRERYRWYVDPHQ
jgi:hypothetical protein